jgi:hypothetical protein
LYALCYWEIIAFVLDRSTFFEFFWSLT